MKINLHQENDKKVKLSLEPIFCKRCHAYYKKVGLGIYKCPECGYEEVDDFGKVRMFLEKNGKSSAPVIAEGTGIPVSKIERFLREGRIEIPDDSDIFIRCESCGTEIKYGRFCPKCALEMCKKLNMAISQGEIGELPKKRTEKMHYLNRNN